MLKFAKLKLTTGLDFAQIAEEFGEVMGGGGGVVYRKGKSPFSYSHMVISEHTPKNYILFICSRFILPGFLVWKYE